MHSSFYKFRFRTLIDTNLFFFHLSSSHVRNKKYPFKGFILAVFEINESYLFLKNKHGYAGN